MRWAFERGLSGSLLAAALSFCAPPARADSLPVDTSYGRVDGDLALVAGLGATVVPSGARAEGELRLRYLESAGVFVTYEDAAVFGSSPQPSRLLATGVELRPLFLYRWLQGHEAGRAWLDLALDSIGLELGGTFAQTPQAGFGSERGFEVGVGVELPLLARASGPWVGVHGLLRWTDRGLSSGMDGDPDRQEVVAITLAWHQLVTTHVVDVGDEAPR